MEKFPHPIPHNRPLITDEDRAAVEAVLRSQWIAQGHEVDGLEADFVSLFGGGQACANASGTASLLLALRGLHLGPGDCVAVPTYACTALLNAVYMSGAKPLIVDIQLDDFTIDPLALDRTVKGSKPAGIIAVHTFGARADIASLGQLSDIVIEDCCQSLGTRFDGALVGYKSSASIFSFYATKVITGGQGGLLWSRSKSVIEFAKEYRNPNWGANFSPRFNVQMTDIQAAMIRSQLKRLDSIVTRRRFIASRFLEAAQTHFEPFIGKIDPERLYYRFVLRMPNIEKTEKLRSFFHQKAVMANTLIRPHELLHRYLKLDSSDFPVSEHIVNTTLSLPIYPALTDNEVNYICDLIQQAKHVI